MLEVKNLVVKIDDKIILNGMNFKVKKGEVHAIMGPNGSGKSTLSKVIAGHPSYQVVEGEILFEINGKMTNIIPIDPYERAREGIFLSFQYPVEVPGVTNTTFLKEAFNSICKHQGADELDPYDFGQLINAKNEILNMNSSFLERGINEGFSGGEKKKNEILQMLLLNPRLSLLDEIDSGLDVDALKIVSKGINTYRNKHNAVVMVTHYQRLLDFVVPDFVHILNNGRIVKSGGRELALEVEAKGYDWVQN